MILIYILLCFIYTASCTYDNGYLDTYLDRNPFRSYSSGRGNRRQRDYDFPLDEFRDYNDINDQRLNDYDSQYERYIPQIEDHLRKRYRKNNYHKTPPKYSFGYGIRDPYHGTNFGHRENRDRDVTNGEYYVDLPDGRLQKVSYLADKNGYRPIIEYIGKAHHPSGPRSYDRKYY